MLQTVQLYDFVENIRLLFYDNYLKAVISRNNGFSFFIVNITYQRKKKVKTWHVYINRVER
jgi:hypothetical protein